ncbi:MAG: hypothetical protein AB1346_12775 [Thermodesulfobacteriota bacterium]
MTETEGRSGSARPGGWELSPRLQNLIAFLLLLLATLPMLTKIFTSDYGTHLAVGREILQNLHIPTKEIWNYPSLGMDNGIGGEWGFTAVLYLVHSAAGDYGVSFMIWAVVLTTFCLMYRATVLRGGHPLLTVLAIFAFSGFLRIRIQPRPEIFTYLFIAATVYLLCGYYFGARKKAIWLFPALILVWANCHPTYLMAFGLCGAFFLDAAARAAWAKEFRWEKLRTWVFPPLVSGFLGLVLCGANPHGYDWLLAPLHLLSRGEGTGSSAILASISELTPVVGTGFYPYFKAAVAFASVTLLLGAFGRRLYLLDIILFLIAFKGAWSSARAVSMMGLFLSPGAAVQLTGFVSHVNKRLEERMTPKAKPSAKTKGKKGKPAAEPVHPAPRASAETGLRWRQAAVLGIIVFALAAFGGTNLAFSMRQLEFGVGMTKHKFSFAAVEFLRKNPIPGRMINFFDIGGFLDWQIYPQSLTFIDGRTYNRAVFQDHQVIMAGAPGWEGLVEKYGATHFIIKAMDSSGTILPIVPVLANHPGWSLVFSDGLFLVFVRNSDEFREFLRKHEVPKAVIPRHIIAESYHYMFLGVHPAQTYNTVANMYLVLGERDNAIETLRAGVAETGNPFLRNRLLGLERAEIPRESAPAR